MIVGCWRDFGVVKAEELIKIPEKWANLPTELLATINVNPPTAYRLLNDFVALKRGDLVIQNGANSAVGRLAIQMASILGARTLNVIRDRPDFEEVASELRELDPNGGATVVKADDLKNLSEIEPPVLGLNCVGGGAVGDMAKIMAADGVIVTYGAMSRRPLTVPASALIFKNLTFKGFWVTSWYQRGAGEKAGNSDRAQMLEDILNWYANGLLKPVKSFWLDVKDNDAQVKEFIKDSWEGKISNKGKCILRFI